MNTRKPSTSNSTLTSATATMEEAEALPPSSIEKMDPEKMTEVGPPVQPGQQDDIEYPTGTKLILIMASLYLAVFLVALDRTIIATAIPRITDDFHSLGDIGWYGSAYLLTGACFQLLFGKIYTFYSPKTIFLIAILIFEIGSAVCGAAPNSTAFIVGRAVAGLGSAGLFSGAVIIIVYTVPLHRRPIFQGSMGAVFGIASVAGPLLGGVFTENVSWRWCFYINLPIGAVALVFLFFFLEMPEIKHPETTLKEKFWRLDPYGTAVFMPAIICLLLALQWGGSTYAWSNWRIILCLVLGGVLVAIFITIQIVSGDSATVPVRIVTQRSIAAGTWFAFCIGSCMLTLVYYLPIYFQADKGSTAVHSGIQNLPLVLSLVVASIVTGIVVTKVGYYTPPMILGSVLLSIGCGLITTLQVDSGHSKWIGYQVIAGFGIGTSMQQPNLAAQTVLSRRDVPQGASLMFFVQTLGGAIFVSVSQNVLTNKLVSGLAGVPGLSPALIVQTGATQLRNVVPPEYLPIVLEAYNAALSNCFKVSTALACATMIGALAMEWRSVKQNKPVKPVKSAENSPPQTVAEPEAAHIKETTV